MIEISLATAKMVVAKDIQEKTGFKEDKSSYEWKTDFDDIYEQVEIQMTIEDIEICFNAITSSIV